MCMTEKNQLHFIPRYQLSLVGYSCVFYPNNKQLFKKIRNKFGIFFDKCSFVKFLLSVGS